jgi:hypothetical protein
MEWLIKLEYIDSAKYEREVLRLLYLYMNLLNFIKNKEFGGKIELK